MQIQKEVISMAKYRFALYLFTFGCVAIACMPLLGVAKALWFEDAPKTTAKNIPLTVLSNTISNLDQVVESHMFGAANSTTESVMPTTSSHIELRGIYNSKDATPRGAAIAIDGVEKIFHIGDTLPDGMILKEVYADYVLLDEKGKIEKLPFFHTKSEAFTSVQPSP